jgi:hypothetical protein
MSLMFQLYAHLSFSNLFSCHLPIFWVIYDTAVCSNDPAILGILHRRWVGRLPCLPWTTGETSLPALKIVGAFHAIVVDSLGDVHTSRGQDGRLPHKPWTAWDITMPAMHIMGDFHSHCGWPWRLHCHLTITQLVLHHNICGKFNITLLIIHS